MNLKNTQSSLSVIAPVAGSRRAKGRASGVAEMKARQARKLREIRDALIAAGVHSLDEQAAVLRLSRSTAWTVLQGNHKGSGLSATIINRMLAAPGLPPPVRDKILEYVEAKAAGLYGHSKAQRRRFIARVLLLSRADSAAKKFQGFNPGRRSNDMSTILGLFVKSQHGEARRQSKGPVGPGKDPQMRLLTLSKSTRS
jgi:hypothetical protein